MNNNTKNSNGNIPKEVLELVPWYAIGKLSVDDRAFFDKALLEYPLLEELLKQELQLIETVSADKSILDLSAIAAQEERLKSVFNMIEISGSETKTQESSDVNVTGSLFEKFKSVFTSFIFNSNGSSAYARIASVAILVVSVAVLTAFVAPIFTEKSDYIPASAVSESNSDKTSVSHTANTVLLVGFNGSSIELGTHHVLKDKLTKIETVPNKEGIFQISFKRELSNDEVEQTIKALLEQKDLIWFAGEEF